MSDFCRRIDFIECHLSVSLWRIFCPLFLIVGIPGNILSIIVLSRPRMRYTATSVYLRLLAVVDTVTLLITIPRQAADFYSSLKIQNQGVFLCKFYPFMTNTTLTLSWCFLPLITLDRLISVRFPVWAKTHSTKRSAVVVFLVLTVALLVLNFHTVLFLTITTKKVIVSAKNATNTTIQTNFDCDPDAEWYDEFRDKIWSWIVFALFSVVPVTFQILCNVLLARELKARFRRNQARRALEGANEQEQRDMRSVTKMLIAISIFFILSSVPQCTQLVLKPYIFIPNTPENRAKSLLFKCFVQLLMYSNNTVNFLLYTLSGRVFRKELRCIFKDLKTYVQQRFRRRATHPQEKAGRSDQKTDDDDDCQGLRETKFTKVNNSKMLGISSTQDN